MIIRLATLNDVPDIMQLVAGVVPVMQASGNFQWDNTYPNPSIFENDVALNQLWVADVEGEIGGIIAITTDQSPEYAEVGWDINELAIVTHRLAVNVNHLRKGIAKVLLNHAEVVAKDHDIRILRVDTNSNNEATCALFPKLGYVFAGEISLAFRGDLRFYCFEKTL